MTGIAQRNWLWSALALTIVILCGFLQARGLFVPVDRPVMEAVGRVRDSGSGQMFTPVAIVLSAATDIGGRLIMLALAAPLLWTTGWRRQWVWLASVTIAAMLLNTALKLCFRAARPALLPHLEAITTYSFPSGHASGNMAFFGALAMVSGWCSVRIAATVLILAIGISRIWLGVHWPSDVLCGWLEGVAILLAARSWLPGPINRK